METTHEDMLLSLVVIFTQSIQLSKIVCGSLRCYYAPWGALDVCGFRHKLKDQFPLLRGDSTSSWFASKIKPQKWFLTFESFGGAERDRTVDPLLAKQVLSQLSYSPIAPDYIKCGEVVGLDRFELSTSPLSGVRSSQLSYRPGRAASSS
jgi:hypothetical protein